MERIPSSPPKIAPLPEETIRPLWSVMIPVYNCTRFIPDALGSVLSQDLGEDQMQIEVVDDGSTDADVEELVMSMGKGRVKYFRQPQNVGSLRNFETCINRANGHLVHLLHGDDRVKDGFYKKFTSLFEEYPEAGAAFCGYSVFDEFGIILKNAKKVQKNEGLLENGYLKMAAGLHIQFVSMVVKREVYEKLGGFYGVIAGEDWEMWTRVAKDYPIVYSPIIMAEYRKYLGTISLPYIEMGVNAKQLAATTLLIESRLPEKDRYVMRNARKTRANTCINVSLKIWEQSRNWELIKELRMLALQLDRTSPEVYKNIFKLYLKILKKSVLSYFLKTSHNKQILRQPQDVYSKEILNDSN